MTCPHGDRFCPCQDGDLCHYEGDRPSRCPTSGQQPLHRPRPRQPGVGMRTPEPLDHAIEEVTGEPILGPRQAALVDAVTSRLAMGFPMTQPDLMVFLNCAAYLRLQTLPAVKEPKPVAS